jgi:Holliday junction resolvase RusA-like endonuclease
MPRPKHHYRTGKYKHLLKKGSPRLHTIKPDIDNLIKFVMDCGQNILWNDDSTICQIESKKIYSKHPRTEIEYWKCPKDNG